MNCTSCGKPCGDGSGLCADCEQAVGQSATDRKPAFSFPGFLASLWKKAGNELKLLKPYLLHPKILLTTAGVVLLLAIMTLLSIFLPGGNGFLEYAQNIEILDLGDDIHILVDDELMSDKLYDRDAEEIRNSLDGNTAAFLTDQKELYVVKGSHLKKVADDVVYYELGADGKGLAYALKNGEQFSLTLYNIEDPEATLLTDEMCSLDFSVSPDGRSAAYYVEGKDNEILTYSDGSKTVTVTYDPSDLVGLSNNGKYIYAISRDSGGEMRLYSYNTRGQRHKLGVVTTTSIKFNRDHTQIMFYNNGKTYISVKGKEAVKASANALYLVTAPNSRSASDNNAITYPVPSLFDHVYTCSDGVHTSAWLIQKNPEKNELLVSNVSSCTLDTSAQYLYYIYDNDELRWVDIRDGASASDRCQTLARDVDAYVLTPDRSRVYFTNNNLLYTCSGKKSGSAKNLCDQKLGYSLCVNRDDGVFFVINSDLYSCANGKSVNMVLSAVESVYQSSNGVVYAYGGGTFYASTQSGKLNSVLEYN